MTTHIRTHIRSLAAAALAVALAGCALDVTNPNAAPEQVAVTTPAGVRAIAVGLQGRYGNALEHAVWVPGLVAGELGTLTNSQSQHREFQRFPNAALNTPRIESTNLDLLAFWSRQYATIRAADDVLAGLSQVTLTPGTESGMTALARTLKAASLGTLAEAWQQVILEPSQDAPTFADRTATLARVLELLASARADLAAQAPST